MAKKDYVCTNCQQNYKQWVGKCSTCGAWNTVEEIFSSNQNKKSPRDSNKKVTMESLEHLGEIDLHNHTEANSRNKTNISELDRVLGGGLVNGTTILLSGEPGIGKSTLLLQLCQAIASSGLATCYVSGEESTAQIRVRANRMEIVNPDIKLITTNTLEDIISVLGNMQSPGTMLIDSVQTIASNDIGGNPGTISQVKACTLELVNLAKARDICLILVGHINKEGQIAGPKLLEHMVDVVLSFEGDNTKQYRLIRGIKNRYGSTNEVGIFEMSNKGLLEVLNPSKIFMPENKLSVSGSCIFAGIEGTRGVLVEVQALVVPSFLPTPRRAAIGWDVNRLSMIMAILNARIGINIMDKEVYLNVAGGTRISETGLDLAVAVSLLSAHRNIPVSSDTVFFGEIGLLGELRSVPHTDNRIKEAAKLGFKKAITAQYNGIPSQNNLSINYIKHIKELLNILMRKQ